MTNFNFLTSIFMTHKIPEGLTKCKVCGWYDGETTRGQFNNGGSSTEKITISCLCKGLVCKKCGQTKIPRPCSNSYDEKSNTFGHWPYFIGMMTTCPDCRRLEKIIEKPFIGFIIDWKKMYYEINLVNPTDRKISSVLAYTGAFCGDTDGLIETSRVTREKGEILSNSSILLEKSDVDGLEFVIWFHLDIYFEGEEKPLKVWFNIPKNGWNYKDNEEMLPVLNKKGQIIELKERN